MSTLVIESQTIMGSLASVKVDHGSRMASEPVISVEPAVLAAPAAKPAAWDPHEVWLSRVKKPREQRLI